MSNSDTATLVVRTGSFANWITAAAAVGTFVVVVKTAKKVIDILSSKDDEDMITKNEQALMDYARQDVDDTLSTFPKKQGPNPPEFHYKRLKKSVSEGTTIGEKLANKAGHIIGKQVGKAIVRHAYKGTIFEKRKPQSKFIQNIRKFF